MTGLARLILISDLCHLDLQHCVHDLPALVPTQFMMSNKLQSQSNPRQLDQYFSNVSMKVNLKLGGSNWSLSSTDLPPKRTIIMGCDVVHPNPGSKAASIAAIVATSDITASDYKAEFRMQDARVEIIQCVFPFSSLQVGQHLTLLR